MILLGNYAMGEVTEGRNKGNFRGGCIRCDSRYTASDMRTLEEALGRHICDPYKNQIMSWISGKERHELGT